VAVRSLHKKDHHNGHLQKFHVKIRPSGFICCVLPRKLRVATSSSVFL
jgi:hypothetical protein